jgi:sugar lactone lactonase YvrE
MLRRTRTLWGLAGATALVVALAPTALAAGHAEVLVAFDPGEGRLPEGVAVDAEGNVYASLTTIGELVKIPAGSTEAEPFGVIEGLAEGEFGPVGLAIDADGNVYSGAMSANPEANGVWRFDAASGEATKIAGSEGIAFANDVDVADDGTLYVSDTIGGAVWRAEPGGPAELWIEDELLAGTGEAGFGFPIGANGIAVDGETVYVGVTEKAHVVAVLVNADGSAGEPSLFAQLPEAVDGIAIDAAGYLISTHPLANLITRLGPDSELEVIATEADGLDRPSTIALRANEDGSTTAYVANFSIAMGTELGNGPSILVLELHRQDG